MSINQNDILNYNPDLNIYSAPSTDVRLEEDNLTIGYSEIDENKSSIVNDFESQSPSKQLKDLYSLLDDIKEYKEKLESICSDNLYANKYFTSTNEETINEIIQENKNDMENGSTPLESYVLLEKIEEEINSIIEEYIHCMFGKDVDIDSAKDLEQAYIDRITQYETTGEYEKINYFNLYYDCQISYLLREYITKFKTICADLGYLVDDPKTTETNNLLSDMFSNSFNDLVKEQNYKLQDDIDCCDNIITAMNNIFIIKSKITNYFDVYSNLSLYGDGIEEIIKIKDDNIKDLEHKLDNLIKTILSSIMSKEELTNILKKKSTYRGFFIS